MPISMGTVNKAKDDVCDNCELQKECPISHERNVESCAMLQNLHFFMRGVDDGRRTLMNRAVIIADTNREHKGYHLIFYKQFKMLNRSNIFNGQIFVDKKRDGVLNGNNALQNLLGENMADSVCFNAFMKFNNVWYPLDVQENARGYQYINFSILYRKKNTASQLLPSEGSIVDLVYMYFIPYQQFGSYLNRTLSYFYEDMEIIFLTQQTIDHNNLNFEFGATITSSDGLHTTPLLLGEIIRKSFVNIGKKEVIQKITSSTLISAELEKRLLMCFDEKTKLAGTSFSITTENKNLMKGNNTRKLELKWDSSCLFVGDKKTDGTKISTVTNK